MRCNMMIVHNKVPTFRAHRDRVAHTPEGQGAPRSGHERAALATTSYFGDIARRASLHLPAFSDSMVASKAARDRGSMLKSKATQAGAPSVLPQVS